MQYRFTFRNKKYETSQVITAISLLVPTIVMVSIFFIIPLFSVFSYSFTNMNATTGVSRFVGWKNYNYLLTSPAFWKSLKNTLIFTLVKLTSEIVFSMIIAVLLDRNLYLRKYLRISFFAPVVVPVVASSIIWIWFFDPTLGPFNQILSFIGLPKSKWLFDESTALMSIVMFSVWRGIGYDIIVFLAGLQGISDSYVEAARVDGASSLIIFFKIKLPLMKPIIAFVTMMGFIGAFQSFTEVDIMTPTGGPGGSTQLIVNYIYNQAFGNSMMGRGTAASIILFLIIFMIIVIQKTLFDGGKEK